MLRQTWFKHLQFCHISDNLQKDMDFNLLQRFHPARCPPRPFLPVFLLLPFSPSGLSVIRFIPILQKNRIMRIAFFIVSLLFFLAWMILSVIRSDLWIAVLTAVMVLISAAQLYLAFRERRRGSRKP